MGSYGPYGLSMPNYSSTSAPAPLTSTSNDDIAAAQVKENNIYVSGQQVCLFVNLHYIFYIGNISKILMEVSGDQILK